jgi:hypothetical protein
MSIDCGQYTGTNNCRFHVSAAAYLSFQDAYAEQVAPSDMLALRDYCKKGLNPSEANQQVSFDTQPFGMFNLPVNVSPSPAALSPPPAAPQAMLPHPMAPHPMAPHPAARPPHHPGQ